MMESSSYAAGLKRKNAVELVERSPSPPVVGLGYDVDAADAGERREMDFFKREKRVAGAGADQTAVDSPEDLRIMEDDLTINVRRR